MIKIQSLPGIMIVLSILLLTACASVAEPDRNRAVGRGRARGER